MATQQQVSALVRAHTQRDDAMFRAVALQVAAGADKASPAFAESLRRAVMPDQFRPVSLVPEKAKELLFEVETRRDLADLVLSADISAALASVSRDWALRPALRDRGLDARRRFLFTGPPGTGKTAAAKALARNIGIPCFLVRLDAVVGSLLGETGSRLRHLFDAIRQVPAVFLLDEFDAVGSARLSKGEQDVAEMRRALNSLLQFMEEPGEGLLVAATNLDAVLDPAVWRRFDVTLRFALPTREEAAALVRKVQARFTSPVQGAAEPLLQEWWNAEIPANMSHAEIEAGVLDAVREAVHAGVVAGWPAAKVADAIRRRARPVQVKTVGPSGLTMEELDMAKEVMLGGL